MKRPTLEQAAFILQAVVAIVLIFVVSGCGGSLADFDREYAISYDATSGQGRLGGRISPANKPGEGKPSLGWEITGDGKAVQKMLKR